MATSFSEIENIKENVQPLRKGRNVKTLVSAMKQPVSEKQQKLEALDSAARESTDIEPWISYVKFVQERFPTGGNDLLKSVIERCTQKFVDDSRYKNDIRYLRLWVQYADISSDSVSIFHFLESKQIGQKLALFYEAYALILENQSQYTEAKRIYEQGIKLYVGLQLPFSEAEPQGRLNRHFTEFQTRVLGYIEKMQDSPGLRPTLKDRSPKRVFGDAKIEVGEIQGNGAAPRFDIFQEENGAISKKEGLNWGKLVPEKERQKENREKPTTWTNSLMDKEEGDEAEDDNTEAVILFQPKAKKASFAVFDDTFKMEKTVKIASKKSIANETQKKREAPSSRDKDGRRKGEIPAYDVNMLIGESGEEFQFEEIRARNYPMIAAAGDEVDMSAESDDMDMDYTCVGKGNINIIEEVRRERLQDQANAANILIKKATENITTKLPFPLHIDQEGGDTPNEVGKGNKDRVFGKDILRTPTCETPSTGDISSVKQRLSFSSAVSPSPALNMRKSAVTRNAVYVDYAGGYNDGNRQAQMATPTATINTKAALSDVMNMFSGNLFDDPTVTATMTGLGLGLSGLKAESKGQSNFGAYGGFDVYQDNSVKGSEIPEITNDKAFDPESQRQILDSLTPPIGEEDGYFANTRPEYAIAKLVHQSKSSQIRMAMMIDGDCENTMAIVKSSDLAVKVTKYNALWEYYINLQIKSRMKREAHKYFLFARSLHSIENQWYMLMNFSDDKNLKQVIEAYANDSTNQVSGKRKLMPQALVIFYSIEILSVLRKLHESNILCCNMKAENLMLRNYESSNARWGPWEPSNPGAWADKGLKLLDFRYAVDLSLLQPDTKLSGCHPEPNMQCKNMRNGNEWLYDQDLHTAAYTIYSMLTGKESDVASSTGLDLRGLYPVWNRVFENLTSCDTSTKSGARVALSNSLSSLQTFLVENQSIARSMKSFLVKQNILLLEGDE